MRRLGTHQRLTQAQPGPWGQSDGPVAGGRAHHGGSPVDQEGMNGGLSVVAIINGGAMATVDTAWPDENENPVVPAGGMGRTMAAGRLMRGLPG